MLMCGWEVKGGGSGVVRGGFDGDRIGQILMRIDR